MVNRNRAKTASSPTASATRSGHPRQKSKMRAVRWLWEDKIPLGEITLLAGREGLGKSTIAYTLAAWITQGTMKGVGSSPIASTKILRMTYVASRGGPYSRSAQRGPAARRASSVAQIAAIPTRPLLWPTPGVAVPRGLENGPNHPAVLEDHGGAEVKRSW